MADVDGTQRRRRIRNPEWMRRALTVAVLDALDEGDMFPTAKQIAARAGVSERSVFVHFKDLDDIRLAAAEEQERRIEALIEPILPGSLEERLDALLRQRERLYPVQTGIRMAAIVHARSSAELTAKVGARRARFRAQIAEVFAPELSAVTDPGTLTALLEAVLDWSFRYQLVNSQAMAPVEATAAVRRATLALLAG